MTHSQIHIRAPLLDDAEALLAFFRHLVRVDPERVERVEDADALTVASEQQWLMAIQRKIAERGMAALTVLEVEGPNKIIGFGEVERRPRWVERHVAEIRFGLLPGYLEQGVQLVSALEAEARALGIEVLYYFHLETQRQGIEIMERSGYQRVGAIERYYKRGDEYVNRVYLAKTLSV